MRTVGDRASITDRLRAAGCVFAEEEADLLLAATASGEQLEVLVERRVGGTPLEHLLGWVAFGGLRIVVEPGVFVPRRRTELLAREVITLVDAAVTVGAPGSGCTPGSGGAPSLVVELCCGVGAVGAVIGHAVDTVELHAVDVDPVAVRCARRNIAAHGDRAHAYVGDLYDPLPPSLRGHVDVLVANPPYVPTEAIGLMPPEARDHEPHVALDGGPDGLDVLRRVVEQAPAWLASGGQVLLELGEEQVPAATAVLTETGLAPRVVHDDELGGTIIIGRRAGPRAPDA